LGKRFAHFSQSAFRCPPTPALPPQQLRFFAHARFVRSGPIARAALTAR
jgi:hypothetical protein